MFPESFARCFTIAKSNLKHNCVSSIGLSLLLLLLTPVIFGINDLSAGAAAVPLEFFVSLNGILLITPLLFPEQREEVRDLVYSKPLRPAAVWGIRLLLSLCILAAEISGMLLLMRSLHCVFSVWNFFLGTFATAFFLGSLGVLAYTLSNTAAVAYMVPAVYYAFHLTAGNGTLKNFYLFSLTQGSMKEKYYLLIAGCIFLLIAFLYLKIRFKKK